MPRNEASAAGPAWFVQQVPHLGGHQGHVLAAWAGRGGRAVQPGQHHWLGPGQQRPDEHLQPADMAGRQAGQPPLARPGAQPGQAGPGRMAQRRRAQLGAFRLAGRSRSGDHHRRPRGQRGGVRRGQPLGTGCGLQRVRAERAEQPGHLVRRQPRVHRQHRRAGAVQRRGQHLEQAPGLGHRRQQDCVQGAAVHRRKVIRQIRRRTGRAASERSCGPGGRGAAWAARVRHPDAYPLSRHHGARGRADRGAWPAGPSSPRSPSTGRGNAPAGWPARWRPPGTAGPRPGAIRCRST